MFMIAWVEPDGNRTWMFIYDPGALRICVDKLLKMGIVEEDIHLFNMITGQLMEVY